MENKIKYIKTQNDENQILIGAVFNDKLIGYIRYGTTKKIWISNLKVAKEFRHNGEKIGTKLLQIFENDCAFINRFIEGKFYPEGESGDVVKKFYNVNGYSVTKEGYDWIVFKSRPMQHDIDIDVIQVDYKEFEKYQQNFTENEKEE